MHLLVADALRLQRVLSFYALCRLRKPSPRQLLEALQKVKRNVSGTRGQDVGKTPHDGVVAFVLLFDKGFKRCPFVQRATTNQQLRDIPFVLTNGFPRPLARYETQYVSKTVTTTAFGWICTGF